MSLLSVYYAVKGVFSFHYSDLTQDSIDHN